MRDIKYIVIHCTAGPETQTLASIQSWWRQLGWRRPGYHHLIAADGTVHNLLPIEQVSNGVAGFNANSIHLSYIGGIKDGKAVDNRTKKQREKLEELVRQYKAQFPKAAIMGHRDFSPDRNRNGIIEPNEWMKTCPSFSVREWLSEIGLIDNQIPPARHLIASKNGGNVNVRRGPGLEYDVVAIAAHNTPTLVLKRLQGWSNVRINDKTVGWVHNDFIK